jgi:hypothetical protein
MKVETYEIRALFGFLTGVYPVKYLYFIWQVNVMNLTQSEMQTKFNLLLAKKQTR